MPLQLSRSNKGWHTQWFYVKNDVAAPLLEFTGCLVEEVPQVWVWGAPDKEKKKLHDHLKAITLLKDRGLHGIGVIRAYHTRRVAPLMARALPLYKMTPDVSRQSLVTCPLSSPWKKLY
jgi:hypothetical protein